MVLTSHSAEWTAFFDSTMPSAPASAIGPSTQKTTASPEPICTPSAAAASAVPPSPRGPARAPRGAGPPPPPRPVRSRSLGVAHVVVPLLRPQPHRVRRLLHPGQQRGHQLLLGVD